MEDIFRIESKATQEQKTEAAKLKYLAKRFYGSMRKSFKKFPEGEREYQQAIKRLEESVFWAVKGLTTPLKETKKQESKNAE